MLEDRQRPHDRTLQANMLTGPCCGLDGDVTYRERGRQGGIRSAMEAERCRGWSYSWAKRITRGAHIIWSGVR